MLTFQQERLLSFIMSYQKTKSITPSYDEMKEALNLKSKSGIHRLVSALEERGYIKKLENKARAIEIIKSVKISFNPEILDNEIINLPLLGKIAAGSPIEAISDETNYFGFPKSMLGSGEYFLLDVVGDSMINVGILDGDRVLIEKSDTANNGEIVVALIDNNETTLKRLFKRGQQVALQPENDLYKTRIYGPDRIKIQGKLKQLIRQF